MPPSLDKLIARCLRKDPNRRAQHALDVRLALEEIQEELASGTSGVAPAVPSRAGAGFWPPPVQRSRWCWR